MLKLNRTCKIPKHRAAEGDRIVDLAISSEAPYERSWGIEILSHAPEAIDLSRLSGNDHPLLLNHCTDDQIGVLLDPEIGPDKVLRCKAKFSRCEDADEVFIDVQDGIRQLVSVGYFIDELVEIEPPMDGGDLGDLTKWRPVRTLTGDEFQREMREKHGDTFARAGSEARGNGDSPPTWMVTRWTPFEASIVPVPADPSVGIGRSAGVDPDPAGAAEIQEKKQIQPIPAPKIIVESKKMEQKTPAELEIERRDQLQAIARQYAKYLGPNDLDDAIRNGRSVEAFKDLIIEKIQSRHTDASQIHVGLTPKEIKRYSLGNAIRAATIGNWADAGFERECSEAVSKIMGRSPEGFYIPPEAFARDFNVGTATEAGNLVPTDLRTDLFVDVLRNKLVLGQLGIRVLSGLSASVDMPRKSTASTIGTVTEIGSASETAPATAKVTLSPKRASAYVEVSKQAIIQSAIALEAMIRDDLVMGTAVMIENLAINGNGTSPQYAGIRNTTGIGTVVGGTNGLAPAWSHFVDLESACANANAEPDSLAGYLINTKTRGKLKQTQFATNLPMIWQNGGQPINGYRALVSNNVPSNLTKGTSTTVCSAAIFGSDWSMGVLGLFGAPDVTVDPYTKADTGQVKITINQFADFGVRQPGAFAKIEDLLS